MIFRILTIFPGLFTNFLQESIIGRAVSRNIIDIHLTDIRNFAKDKHRTVDDYPYGGGPGMVMKPEPLHDAINSLKRKREIPVIYFTPQGKLLDQKLVNEYGKYQELILVCGHYKEIDQRIRETLISDEISIGDYVVSGGELPSMIFIDALTRIQPGALNDIESALTDSHQNGLLGYPYYTRPPEFKGMKVPEVLLSGNHQKIEEWRKAKAREITKKNRPDLLKNE